MQSVGHNNHNVKYFDQKRKKLKWNEIVVLRALYEFFVWSLKSEKNRKICVYVCVHWELYSECKAFVKVHLHIFAFILCFNTSNSKEREFFLFNIIFHMQLQFWIELIYLHEKMPTVCVVFVRVCELFRTFQVAAYYIRVVFKRSKR